MRRKRLKIRPRAGFFEAREFIGKCNCKKKNTILAAGAEGIRSYHIDRERCMSRSNLLRLRNDLVILDFHQLRPILECEMRRLRVLEQKGIFKRLQGFLKRLELPFGLTL